MPRIAPLEPPYPDAVGAELAAMMPPGMDPLLLFRTLARNPRILGKIRAANLLDRGSLERRDRELVILRTCARLGCEYEWGVHVTAFARRFGIPDPTIAGSVHWQADDPRWTDAERPLIRLVDELQREARVSDALWKELRDRFREDQIVELLVLVGFYHTISFVTNALQIEREPAGARFPGPTDLTGPHHR